MRQLHLGSKNLTFFFSHNRKVAVPPYGFLLLWLILGILICPSIERSIYASESKPYEAVYLTTSEALSAIFPKATTIVTTNFMYTPSINETIEERLGWSVPERSQLIYLAYKETKLKGYALIIDELGKHEPITSIVGVTPKFKVSRVAVMVYREHYGAEVRKNRFLKQFKSKTSNDTLAVDDDIDGISGATISSWSLTATVKKAIIITEEFVKHESKN